MKSLVIACMLLAVPPAFAGSACPVSQLLSGSQGFGQGVEIDAAEGDLNGAPVVPGVKCLACFSWAAGYFRASGYTGTDWGTAVDAYERFELVGPSPGAPLSFSARLRASGTAEDHGYGSVGITEAGGASNVLPVAGPQTLSDVPVVLPLQHFAGDSFTLNVQVWAGSTTYPYVAVDLQAAFEFVDVPTGWSIVSCRGVDVPVPATATTWGSLRAMYR